MLSRNFCSRGKAVDLHKAVDSLDYEGIKQIIEAGADVNFKLRGSTPLMKVITKNMTKMHSGYDTCRS